MEWRLSTVSSRVRVSAWMTRLREFWLYHGPDIRGAGIIAGFLLAIVMVLYGYSRMADPPAEFLGPVEGRVATILRAPTPGTYANASSPWEILVQLSEGDEVEATTLFLPDIGGSICLASYSKGRLGIKYRAVGNPEVMAERGRPCSQWQPRTESGENSD